MAKKRARRQGTLMGEDVVSLIDLTRGPAWNSASSTYAHPARRLAGLSIDRGELLRVNDADGVEDHRSDARHDHQRDKIAISE